VSSSNHPDCSRRSFITLAATAGSASLLGLRPGLAPAQGATGRLSTTDSTAQALGYVEDATTTTDPAHKAGQICSSCHFFQGAAGKAWGPCQIFMGKGDVSAKGWCKSFIAKS
jgi:hypothetical protein